MKKQFLPVLVGFILVGVVLLGVRPVTIPREQDCRIVEGTVTDIYEAGVKDVVFRLREHPQRFYINRGLARGLNLSALRATLTNREIVIKYPDHWTPLDPTTSTIHISKLEQAGQVVFTELP